MIFQHTWPLILSGQKTQTRRPEREGDEGIRTNGVPEGYYFAVIRNGRVKWQVGKIYAIQPGRGKKAIGYIRPKSIRRERANEINEEDARAEGVTAGWGKGGYWNPASGNFANLWDSIYSGSLAFTAGPMVWVLEFERVD